LREEAEYNLRQPCAGVHLTETGRIPISTVETARKSRRESKQMAIRPIITLPDPRLRLVSEPVTTFDGELQQLLDDMLETMYEAPGVGLAAIQIAVPKRIVVADATRGDEPKNPLFVINPQIVWASEELFVYQEGCLSVPDYFEDVQRPARVRVRYLDRAGATQEIEADGLLATVLQHEIDHLEGGLFIDHLSRLKRDRVVKKFAKAAARAAPAAPVADKVEA
jgi:peptide deformylase